MHSPGVTTNTKSCSLHALLRSISLLVAVAMPHNYTVGLWVSANWTICLLPLGFHGFREKNVNKLCASNIG